MNNFCEFYVSTSTMLDYVFSPRRTPRRTKEEPFFLSFVSRCALRGKGFYHQTSNVTLSSYSQVSLRAHFATAKRAVQAIPLYKTFASFPPSRLSITLVRLFDYQSISLSVYLSIRISPTPAQPRSHPFPPKNPGAPIPPRIYP
jgi:hypothetical protein